MADRTIFVLVGDNVPIDVGCNTLAGWKQFLNLVVFVQVYIQGRAGLPIETNLFVFFNFLPALVVVQVPFFTLGLLLLRLMFHSKTRSNEGTQQGSTRERRGGKGE